MHNKQSRIYLSSKSPRRRELLKQVGVNFEMLLLRSDPSRAGHVDESPLENENPVDYVQRICQLKACSGRDAVNFRGLPMMPILAADTTVTIDNQIIGKPRDNAHAAEILRLLSGRQHQVLTAVAVAYHDLFEMRLSTSTITFAKLDEARIHHYLLTNEAHDKAGAYGIQGHAGMFVEHLTGSYTGVMGLPLFETAELLRKFGYPIL